MKAKDLLDDPLGQLAQHGLIRTEMFPNVEKLADARRMCKFFEYLGAKGMAVVVVKVDQPGQLVDIPEQLFSFLGIDMAKVQQEGDELLALADDWKRRQEISGGRHDEN